MRWAIGHHYGGGLHRILRTPSVLFTLAGMAPRYMGWLYHKLTHYVGWGQCGDVNRSPPREMFHGE